jgi:hypothetical protein
MIRSLSSVAPALTTIRAHLAGVAAPLLRRAGSALQRAANACDTAAIASPANPTKGHESPQMPESQRLFVPLDEKRTLVFIVRGKIVEITVVYSRPDTMWTLQETVTFNIP